MNILFSLHHPAQVHQFKYIIKTLINEGNEVSVLTTNKDGEVALLDKFGISYTQLCQSTGKTPYEKLFYFFLITLKTFVFCLQHKTDVFVSRASPMLAINAFIFRKPHIVYEDTEIARLNLKICKALSTTIITPTGFRLDLGKKQVKLPTYKELSYLHSNYFKPDLSVFEEINLQQDSRFVVLRFIAWNASHDFGSKGLTYENKVKMVHELAKYTKVFVSSEAELPEDIRQYQLKTSVEKIHSVLYYAQLLLGESGTMSTESALLGTPAVCVSSSALRIGVFEELEQNGLIYIIPDSKEALDKTVELLKMTDLKKTTRESAKELIKKKVDLNSYIINLIRNGGKIS